MKNAGMYESTDATGKLGSDVCKHKKEQPACLYHME